MSRRTRLCPLVLAGALMLSACGGGSAPAAAPSVDPTEAQLQHQLDDLPAVDGATRSARELEGATLTESYTVPAGTPACLQLLASLDAGGYEVVAGTDPGVPVDPGTCRTATGTPGVDTTTGTATILARGGSQIGLTWTSTAYTLTASER